MGGTEFSLFRYQAAFAEAQRERDYAKERRDIYAAKKAKELRESEGKITEKAIQFEIDRDPEYLRLQKIRIDKEYMVNLLFGATIAINQRKSALENLVKLNAQEYFSSPTVARNLGEEVSKYRAERRRNAAVATEAVKKSMKAKKVNDE